MSRLLPIGDPPAYGYQFYAFPLAILTIDPGPRDWILSNYIQTAYDPAGPGSPVPFCFYFYDYTDSPWLEVVKLSREWVGLGGRDIVDICRDAVHAGFYPYLNVDEFYIPQRLAYGTRHCSHDILVRGVDDDGTFTVYGYSDRRVMATTTVSQRDFAASYTSLDEIPNTCFQVYFYRPRTDVGYRLTPRIVREAFEEYLSGANCSTRFGMLRDEWDRAYGMHAYRMLVEYLDRYLANDTRFDARHFHILWEHKHLMTARMRRLSELTGGAVESLVAPCEQMEADALALRNGMLRHEYKNRSSTVFTTTSPGRLARLRDTDEQVLTAAVDALKAFS